MDNHASIIIFVQTEDVACSPASMIALENVLKMIWWQGEIIQQSEDELAMRREGVGPQTIIGTA